MTLPEITVATPADRDRVTGVLVAAFVKDPVLRYLFPDEDTYPGCAAAFFGYLFDKRVAAQSIWTAEQGASVAIWEGPGPAGAPSVPGSRESLASLLPAGEFARVEAYDEAVHAALPAERHWYLGVLGTHPDHTGRRLGHAVMAAGLRRAALDGLPAVLETSNPANVEMYRRAGWEVARAVTSPLPIWVMRHPAPKITPQDHADLGETGPEMPESGPGSS